MENKNTTEVLIDGRKYAISGVDSDDYAQQIATYINHKFAEFKQMDYYERLDMDLRNVLLAINIADDYYKAKDAARDYHEQIQKKDKMILDMKHEMIKLQDQVDRLQKEKDEMETSWKKDREKRIELETKLKQRK